MMAGASLGCTMLDDLKNCLIVATALCGIIVGHAYYRHDANKAKCDDMASHSNLRYSYTLMGGCQYELAPGYWMVAESK